jgi:membrane protein YdbS with pleckstrin-like domain
MLSTAVICAAAFALLTGGGLLAVLAVSSLVHLATLEGMWTGIGVNVETRSLLYRRGLVWRSEYRIPLDSIQVVMVKNGPFSRRLGWETVVVYAFGGRPIRMRAPVTDPIVRSALSHSA